MFFCEICEICKNISFYRIPLLATSEKKQQTVVSNIKDLSPFEGYEKHYWCKIMASNKKINVPISDMSSNQIYALFEVIDWEEKEDIEILMNNSDAEFLDHGAIENGDADSDLSPVENIILWYIALMVINKLLKLRDYWSIEEGLGYNFDPEDNDKR